MVQDREAAEAGCERAGKREATRRMQLEQLLVPSRAVPGGESVNVPLHGAAIQEQRDD